ncbi:hypothetical protein [Cellulosimicrobium sp. NPDC057127]|uniref:hypothetical protein n=1 Tax=Cellulosimicrobium sp. NPDC057127 TaxID=3346026 RepID=UPI003629A88A
MMEPTRPRTPAERAVLGRLCAGQWSGASVARAQAAVATFAGRAHAGDDLCFAPRVPDDVPRLPPIEDGTRR